MKCQNCGKNEINFHYSSNVNGCVTETHLCSECAAKQGYDFGSIFSSDFFRNDFFPMSIRNPFIAIPMFGFGMASPFLLAPQAGLPSEECSCEGSCEAPVQKNPEAEVDGDMQKRREINIIREQMRLAAEKEDFEKAAELRDQIRKLEASEE